MSTAAEAKCGLCGEPTGADHKCSNPLGKFLGKTIDNRYRVDRVLGKGGMGVVFAGVQTSVQRPVAIKMLNPALADTPAFFERFRREAELVSRLHHPNIITVYDFGKSEDGACYYVMELVEGESLRNVVRRDGPLPIARAVRIIEQIARALGLAHAQSVIHRDLKPHNVMLATVDGQDHCKVLDFGLVKLLEGEDKEEQLTTTGQVLGTPSYMAPEQAAGDPCDQRADLFSLGVCLFYCLAGSPPFKTNSAQKALIFLMSNQTPTVGSMRVGAPIPEALEAFLKRTMAFDKEERPANAEQFIEEMKAAIAGLSEAELNATPDGAHAPPDIPGLTPSKITGGSKAGKEAGTVAARPRTLSGERPSNIEVAPEITAAKRKTGLVFGFGGLAVAGLIGGGLWFGGVIGPKDAPCPSTLAARDDAEPAKKDPEAKPVEAQKPPEPAKPTNATLKLESEPAGASVFNGGTLLGQTPATLILPREAVNLTFKLDGYQPLTQGVDLASAKDGEPMNVKVTLVAAAPQVKEAVHKVAEPSGEKKTAGPGSRKGPDIPTFGE